MPQDFARIIRNLRHRGADFVVIGANAAIAQGAPIGTIDLDLGYRRTLDNVRKIVEALAPFHPRLRGVEVTVPFVFSVESLRKGCNFNLVTDAGDLDLLGHITGLGDYDAMIAHRVELKLFGCSVPVMGLEDVIRSKRAAGRAKDKAVLPILEETLRLRCQGVQE